MDMTERDNKILKKISEKLNELSETARDSRIKRPDDLSKIPSVVRRGIIAFISDIFELTKPLSDSAQQQLPFSRNIIKSFRDTSTHNYGKITDAIAHACLTHCIDKNSIDSIQKLIDDYSN